MDGWIKLHRKIIDSPVFDNSNVLKLWIWCLCKASHTDHEVIVGKQIVKLDAGQFVFGRMKAAAALNMNDRTVYDYMKMLQKLGMIDMQPNNKFTVVTIVNWAFYQYSDADIQQQNTQQCTINDTQHSTIKNHTYKKEKNVKNDRNIFIKPSIDEVRAYCRERNSTVDPEAFMAFYESNGWKVGQNNMKSWKAAVITWEKKNQSKESRGNYVEQRRESESSVKLW